MAVIHHLMALRGVYKITNSLDDPVQNVGVRLRQTYALLQIAAVLAVPALPLSFKTLSCLSLTRPGITRQVVFNI